MKCLSDLYQNGDGVESNLVLSFQRMKRAAIGGAADSLQCMAQKYHYGEGCEKDDEKALI
jgi:TPR repeat protein